MSKQKYSPAYIKYGFTTIEHGEKSLPHCIVCMKTLVNPAMKPSLFKRHLNTKYLTR